MIESQKNNVLLNVKRSSMKNGGGLFAESHPTFETSWTVAWQALLSMGFSKQECWSGFPLHLPGDLPNPRIKSKSPVAPALVGGFFTSEPPGK